MHFNDFLCNSNFNDIISNIQWKKNKILKVLNLNLLSLKGQYVIENSHSYYIFFCWSYFASARGRFDRFVYIHISNTKIFFSNAISAFSGLILEKSLNLQYMKGKKHQNPILTPCLSTKLSIEHLFRQFNSFKGGTC